MDGWFKNPKASRYTAAALAVIAVVAGCSLAATSARGWSVPLAKAAPAQAAVSAAPDPLRVAGAQVAGSHSFGAQSSGSHSSASELVDAALPASSTDALVASGPAAAAAAANYSPSHGIASLVSPTWAADVAARTGIPERAVQSYAGATLAVAAENPGCRAGWTTFAALGELQSGHTALGGGQLGADGTVRPAILGPLLDGTAGPAVADTDHGLLDGNTRWDRAVGPLQFMPSLWKTWGSDGNGDGVADPQNLDDSALSAARFLCSFGDQRIGARWRGAIYAFKPDAAFVESVAEVANTYAKEAG